MEANNSLSETYRSVYLSNNQHMKKKKKSETSTRGKTTHLANEISEKGTTAFVYSRS